jgi:hypothetical protein
MASFTASTQRVTPLIFSPFEAQGREGRKVGIALTSIEQQLVDRNEESAGTYARRDNAAFSDGMISNSEWDGLLNKLIDLESLSAGWDSYKAPAPAARAITRAYYFLSRLRIADLLPNRCAPSVIGGIGVTLRRGPREVCVEFYNEGNIHSLFSDDATEQMDDKPVSPDPTDQDAFIAEAQRYLNA